jgi:hypothetical protein
MQGSKMYKGGEAGVTSIRRLVDQIEGAYLAIAKGNGIAEGYVAAADIAAVMNSFSIAA